jgi:hypothetical protein
MAEMLYSIFSNRNLSLTWLVLGSSLMYYILYFFPYSVNHNQKILFQTILPPLGGVLLPLC